MKYIFFFLFLLFSTIILRSQDTLTTIEYEDLSMVESQPIETTLLDSFSTKSISYGRFFTSADGIVYLYNKDNIIFFDSIIPKRSYPSAMLFNSGEKTATPSIYSRYDYKSDRNFIGLHRGKPASAIAFSHAPALGKSTQPFIFSQNKASELNTLKIYQSLAKLGLQEEERFFDKASSSSRITYDRLFLYESGDKILVVWHNNNELLANFMDRSGNWLLATPTVIHGYYYADGPKGEITSYDHTLTNYLFSDVNDMALSYNGISYFLSYQISFSVPSLNIDAHDTNTIVTVKLNDELEVQEKIETPEILSSRNNIIHNKMHLQSLFWEDGLIRLVASNTLNPGEQNLTFHYLNEDLKSVIKKTLLTASLAKENRKYPIEQLEDGYLISYRENHAGHVTIISRKIYFDGRVSKPFYLNIPREFERIAYVDYTTELIDDTIKYTIIFNHEYLSSIIVIYNAAVKQFDE